MSKELVRVWWVLSGALSGLFAAMPVAIACSLPDYGDWEPPTIDVGDPDGFVPAVVDYGLTFTGPDICDSSSCYDLAVLNVSFDLGDAEWPLGGSFDRVEATEFHLFPGYEVEFQGDVPCEEAVLPSIERARATTGSLNSNQYGGSVVWICQPDGGLSWSFDARFRVKDVHGELGEWTEWRRFQHNGAISEDECAGRDRANVDPGIALDGDGCSATGSAPTNALPWLVTVVGLALGRRRRS